MEAVAPGHDGCAGGSADHVAVVAAQLDPSGVEGVEERGLDLRAVEADIVVPLRRGNRARKGRRVRVGD